MARFYGEIGYGISVEKSPGVWDDEVKEVSYQGDVLRNIVNQDQVDKLNSDISVFNSISIVADQYAIEHFMNIRYVRWSGVRWTVRNVEVRVPRLILSLGSVYNGSAP